MALTKIKTESPDLVLKAAPYNENQLARVGHLNSLIDELASKATTVGTITSANLVGVDGTGSNAAPLVETEARLDAIEAKLNALITALS